MFQFTIEPGGEVGSAMYQSSTVYEESLVDCIGRAICDFQFPKPDGGGRIIVSYPFTFTPASPANQ
jgi:hypothetical protein